MSTEPPVRPKFESTLFTERDAARTIARSRKPYFERASFILTGISLGAMLIFWAIGLVDRGLLFGMYPMPVIAVWRIIPLCVLVAVALGWGKARKAIIVSRCALGVTAVAIVLYMQHFGAILPMRQVFAHSLGVVCCRLTGVSIGELRGHDALAATIDYSGMTAANKPAGPPDYVVGVFLDDSVSPFTKNIADDSQQSSLYWCPYYSAENVIADPGASEYMQAPMSFKTWFQNSLTMAANQPPSASQ